MHFAVERALHINEKVSLIDQGDKVSVEGSNKTIVDQVVTAVGRASNIKDVGLDALDIPYDDNGFPYYDKTTMQIDDTSLFIAGDLNKERPLLHEAADEGRIAGFNATHFIQCFQRRTPIHILFTEPNIAVVGMPYKDIKSDRVVIGEVSFADQGRAKILHRNKGILRVYGRKQTGQLLGAEMIAPNGEHLAHLLAWAIQSNLTVFDVLKMPFYHPTIEEGMRTALRDLANKVNEQASQFDLAMCDSEAISPLS